MPVRKPTNTSQFDLFAAPPPAPPRPAPIPAPPKPANDRPAPPIRSNPPPAAVQQPPPPNDEWWTTRMTCAFLKISRKTLWERRRDPDLNFPQPVQLGGTRNVYRASAIRTWAEGMAVQSNT